MCRVTDHMFEELGHILRLRVIAGGLFQQMILGHEVDSLGWMRKLYFRASHAAAHVHQLFDTFLNSVEDNIRWELTNSYNAYSVLEKKMHNVIFSLLTAYYFPAAVHQFPSAWSQ